ncbi:hypothetical protein HK405_009138, partial [Cladochytrium tenue]
MVAFSIEYGGTRISWGASKAVEPALNRDDDTNDRVAAADPATPLRHLSQTRDRRKTLAWTASGAQLGPAESETAAADDPAEVGDDAVDGGDGEEAGTLPPLSPPPLPLVTPCRTPGDDRLRPTGGDGGDADGFCDVRDGDEGCGVIEESSGGSGSGKNTDGRSECGSPPTEVGSADADLAEATLAVVDSQWNAETETAQQSLAVRDDADPQDSSHPCVCAHSGAVQQPNSEACGAGEGAAAADVVVAPACVEHDYGGHGGVASDRLRAHVAVTAARSIQRAARRWIARRRQERAAAAATAVATAAAVRVQAVARGFLARRMVREAQLRVMETAALVERAAVTIQRAYRGAKAQRLLQGSDLHAAEGCGGIAPQEVGDNGQAAGDALDASMTVVTVACEETALDVPDVQPADGVGNDEGLPVADAAVVIQRAFRRYLTNKRSDKPCFHVDGCEPVAVVEAVEAEATWEAPTAAGPGTPADVRAAKVIQRFVRGTLHGAHKGGDIAEMQDRAGVEPVSEEALAYTAPQQQPQDQKKEELKLKKSRLRELRARLQQNQQRLQAAGKTTPTPPPAGDNHEEAGVAVAAEAEASTTVPVLGAAPIVKKRAMPARNAAMSAAAPTTAGRPATGVHSRLMGLGPVALERLTNANTGQNAGYNSVQILVEVVKRDHPRPPSPSQRLKDGMASRAAGTGDADCDGADGGDDTNSGELDDTREVTSTLSAGTASDTKGGRH